MTEPRPLSVTADAPKFDIGWYRRCANEAGLSDELGLRNALNIALDQIDGMQQRILRQEQELARHDHGRCLAAQVSVMHQRARLAEDALVQAEKRAHRAEQSYKRITGIHVWHNGAQIADNAHRQTERAEAAERRVAELEAAWRRFIDVKAPCIHKLNPYTPASRIICPPCIARELLGLGAEAPDA